MRSIAIIAVIIAIIIAALGWYNYVLKQQLVKIPPEIAKKMKEKFGNKDRTMDKIRDHLVELQFPINSFTSITDDIKTHPNKESYTLRVYFIQITPDFLSKYPDFGAKLEYNEKLYIAFQYVDEHNKKVGDPFLYNKHGKKYYIVKEFEELHNAYLGKIKPKIDPLVPVTPPNKKNTEYVKIDVKDLIVYINKINKYFIDKPYYDLKFIIFELAESAISNKRIGQDGYLTFINSVYVDRPYSLDLVIEDLSDYDMNSLCPPTCP